MAQPSASAQRIGRLAVTGNHGHEPMSSTYMNNRSEGVAFDSFLIFDEKTRERKMGWMNGWWLDT